MRLVAPLVKALTVITADLVRILRADPVISYQRCQEHSIHRLLLGIVQGIVLDFESLSRLFQHLPCPDAYVPLCMHHDMHMPRSGTCVCVSVSIVVARPLGVCLM